jgi:S-adenosylmethionine:tRNA ribosyltransferase-isomerase
VQTALFDYFLPESAIATEPPVERDGARLCVLGPEGPSAKQLRELPEELSERDLLVLNETKVRPARARCRKKRVGTTPGGQVEVLFLKPLEEGTWEVLTRAGSKLLPGDVIEWPQANLELTMLERLAGGTALVRASGDVELALESLGEMPLPPYMKRPGQRRDRERYQTVFARELGSAAAPTAGLHFTPALLERVRARGTDIGVALLHVGLGTFRPVATPDLNEHPMHEEWYSVGQELVRKVQRAKQAGGRVVAVGTTVVRALESAAAGSGDLVAGSGMTRLLIQPGYEFRVVDAMLTNFHQPKSTLLALVAAFSGRERVLDAYNWALKNNYRFLSYGDAMWIPERTLGEGGHT